MIHVMRLRTLADNCRQFSFSACDNDARGQLLALAAEYGERADELEAFARNVHFEQKAQHSIV